MCARFGCSRVRVGVRSAGTVVETSQLAAVERVEPPWRHIPLSEEVLLVLVRFLGSAECDEPWRRASEAPAAGTAAASWGTALLAVLKSSVLGVLASALSSGGEARDRLLALRMAPDSTVREGLLGVLRTVAALCPPSACMAVTRTRSRQELAHAINVAADQFAGSGGPRAELRDAPPQAAAGAALVGQACWPAAVVAQLPSGLSEWSAPNVVLSEERLAVEFVASHTLSVREEGVPNVQHVVVTADACVPVGDPTFTDYYFEVTVRKLDAAASEVRPPLCALPRPAREHAHACAGREHWRAECAG